MLFSLTISPDQIDQPVCSFSVTSPFLQGVFPKHQNTLQEYLHYVKVTLIHLKVLYMKPFLSFLGITSLVFHQNHQIYCRQHARSLFYFSRVR